ncbi:hypothetical protein AB684_15180 [Bacillus licheniformis]|nr:hypothetical protein AB684_15180 [Bacillus licheniformis]ATI77116.1 hypothetical protein CPQ91_15150 [Bacillus licheniformis]OKS81719.1 hypothetical protein BFN05_15080 [Bacillus licheniformis]PAE46386.1 hypothetical protein CHH94_12350 [Bacillus licheniformis]PAE70656.1 hypothetical protein CHH84_19580 [Bacillus licheniformis]
MQLKKAFPPTVDAAHLAGQRGEKAFLSAVPPLFAAFESRLMDNRLSGLITSEPVMFTRPALLNMEIVQTDTQRGVHKRRPSPVPSNPGSLQAAFPLLLILFNVYLYSADT